MANIIIQKSDPYGTAKRSPEGRSIARSKDYVRGWWENIDREPIFIQDKEHLKRVCLEVGRREGRTVIPRMFAKPKSQGKGFEWSY